MILHQELHFYVGFWAISILIYSVPCKSTHSLPRRVLILLSWKIRYLVKAHNFQAIQHKPPTTLETSQEPTDDGEGAIHA